MERDIRTAIMSGNMGSGERLRSCRDFSSQYGITYSRVQRVFKRLEGENFLYSRRGGGTFVAETITAHRSSGGAQIVPLNQTVMTLITPRYTLDAAMDRVMPAAEFIRGAESWLDRHQSRLQVIFEEEVDHGALDRLSPSEKRIIVGLTVSNSVIARFRALAKTGSQIVLIGRNASHSSWALTCDADGRAGIRQAVEHLCRFGHRQIGLLSYEPDSSGRLWWVQEREEGYLDAMKEAGLPAEIRRLPGDLELSRTEIKAIPEIDEWVPAAVRQETGLTALICVHDPLAQCVADTCRRHDIGLPEDLSLTGYDDIPWAIGQGLTTIQRPYRETGEMVADIALRALRHPGFVCRGPLYIAPKLVSRSSVSSPRY